MSTCRICGEPLSEPNPYEAARGAATRQPEEQTHPDPMAAAGAAHVATYDMHPECRDNPDQVWPFRPTDEGLIALHRHYGGQRRRAEFVKDEDGAEFAVCGCGERFLLGGERGGRAKVR